MHILLSNDDGYLAEGLTALASALMEHAQISVVAPDRNRSAASNSLTLEMPLRTYSADNGLSKNINTNPGLSMKPIDEQKTYLDENDITNVNFDYVKNDNFNYVEDDDNKIRYEPGNIQNFISWFIENVIKKHKNVKKLIY